MSIIQSWKNSIQVLMPQNAKPFLLVTVKTVLDSYTAMMNFLKGQSAWHFAMVIVPLIIASNVVKELGLFVIQERLCNGMLYLVYFVSCLAMRSSVGLKDKAYYIAMAYRFRYVFLITILLGLTGLAKWAFLLPTTFIWYIFFLLFMFDSAGTVRDTLHAARNSLIMVLYNFPLAVVLYCVLSIINILLYGFVMFALNYFGGLTLAFIAYCAVIPIEVALLTNVYIKRFHDQSKLYVELPK